MSDLAVEHVTKEYPTRGEPLVVLRDVSLSLDRGQSAAIVGPSGSGKSTLLNVIGTLDAPTSGSVSIAGQNPYALREAQLAHFRKSSGPAI
jgi:lipoprotein-releasing system ATP-binding protein